MEVELLSIYRKDKKINLYLPKFSDIFNSVFKKEDIEFLIQQRKNAKKAKNFAEADRIRNQLKSQGIILVDQKDGITTWDTECFLGQRILKLFFEIPEKMNVKMSYPNPTYLKTYSLEIYSRYLDIAWISSDEHLFNNFHLASNFVLDIRKKKYSLVNDWDEKKKIMLVGGSWEK